MLRKLILAGFLALLAFAISPANAQQAIAIASCGSPPNTLDTGVPHVIYMDTTGKLCTAASVSASISGFPTTQSTGTPISVTTSGVTGTLPAGAVVVATNVGTTNAAYCKLGATATTSDQYIAPNGGWFAFTVGASTQLTCITSTSTTTVNMVGGSGLPTGTGGGGGGSGGSSAITSWGGGTLGAMANYGTSPGSVLVPGVNAFVTNTLAAMANNADGVAASTGNASPVGAFPFLWNGTTWDRWKSAGSTGVAAVRNTDGTRNSIVDPCEGNLQTYATGVITSATTTRIVAPSASNKTYVCMFFTKASAADSVGVYEGTGGTCGTGKAGVLGGTTTANGLVFGTAGDGVLLQAGGKVAAMQTAGTNVDLCLETSTTGPLIYAIKYVQAP